MATINSEDPNNGYFTPLTVYAKELYIHDITLTTTGNHYGINGGTAGSTPNQSTLRIENAAVTSRISSKATGDAAIAGFKACTLEKCEPTNNTYYDSSKRGFKAAEGDDFAKLVIIKPSTPYDLWILGKQMTSQNCSNFTADGLTSGTVSYDSSTKTLTLDGATLQYNTSSDQAIRSDILNLNVNVVGDNTITNKQGTFLMTAPTTIYGSGTLTLNSAEDCCLYAMSTNLTIKDVAIDANGMWGIAGYNGSTEILTISNAAIHAKGENGAICDFKTVTLSEGLAVSTPVGGKVSGGAIVDAAGKVAKEAVIAKIEDYGHAIGDIAINSSNCNDVLGDGTVSYDNATRTLTFNNTTYSYTGSKPLIELSKDVMVKLIGTNVLTSTGEIGLRSKYGSVGKITIGGDGSMSIKSNWAAVYLCIDMDLTVTDNATLEVIGKIMDNNLINAQKLTVKGNATLTTTGTISHLSALNLEDGHAIIEPAGAEFKDNGVYVGSTLATNIIIGVDNTKTYDLFVNGTQVNEANAADILGDGKVVYDAEANELTLDGATLTGIQNRITDLKVIVKGDNTIENNADNAILIDSYANITFEGDGKLNLKSTNPTSLGMRLAATFSGAGSVLRMTLEGPAFNITAGQGLYGTGFDPILDICYPTTLSFTPVEGGNANPISGFLGFNFSQLTIVAPEGAYYNTSNRYVQYNDARYTGALKIDVETYNLWIAGTQVTEVNKDDILGDGVFSYVSWYKTLHIAGDYANTADCRIIESNIEDLIINVDVDSKLTTTTDDYMIIYLRNNTEIRGLGTLTLESYDPEQSNIAIYQELGDKLTISNANIVVGDGFSYAITGEPNVALEVIASDIVAKAHYEGCFKDFGSMTLSGCYIDSPRGAVYENEALRDADGHIIGSDALYETVVIKSGADAVDGLDADAAAADIFDVAGRKLDQIRRTGIYIVGGKKVSIK